jgi:GNAT superfamily N-acetyltransferase
MTEELKFRVGSDVPRSDLVALYGSVGWTSYMADLEGLERAVFNSSYVVSAWKSDQLVGLARGVSDDVSIFYLQDILVHPAHQRRGIGRALLQRCLERYAHVMQKVLLTDEEPKQLEFYASLGYKNTRGTTLNVFVQMEGIG